MFSAARPAVFSYVCMDHHISYYSESVFWWTQMKWRSAEDLLSGLFLKITVNKTWNELLNLNLTHREGQEHSLRHKYKLSFND